jgi:hypothetical protein
MHGRKRKAYRILIEKSETKRQFEKPRRRLLDNIKIDIKEIVFEVVD